MKTLCLAAALLLASSLPAQPPQHQQPRYEDIYGHPLPPQKHVTVFGQSIAYYDMGASKPGEPVLVLLHGYGSQADVDFGPAVPALSRTHRVIALDQIGSGNSSKPYIAYHVQTYVDWLAEFLRVTHISKFDLLGESLGGWTAALYAEQAAAPNSSLPKPTHLILEDAAGYKAPQGPEPPLKMTVSTPDETMAGLKSVFFHKDLITPEVARRRFISKLQANDAFAAATFSTNPDTHNESAGDKLSTITAPTLVLWGAEDTLVPRAWAEGFAHDIPNAQLVLINSSGHIPSLEQPAKFVEAVNRFLAH